MPSFDDKVAALAARYLSLAARILAEAIRIPADYVDQPGRGRRRPALRPQQPRGAADGVPEADGGRGGRRAPPGRRGFRRLRQPRLVGRRTRRTASPPATRRSSTWTATPTPCRRCARSGGRRRTAGSTPTTASSISPASTARRCAALLGYLPPDDEWEHLLFGRGSADQLAGVVSQIVATKILLELAPEGALRGVHRPLVRHGRRGGQRRRRPASPDGPRPARRPARARPRRRDPHRGHGRLEEGRPRHLPRPARAHADRGRGDRPLVPRLDAVGGPQPARARRRDRGRGGAALRRARGLPRPPVPRPWHAHRLVGAARHARATAPCPSGSRSGSTGGSRSARRRSRPCATSRRSTPCGRRERRGCGSR